MSRKWRNILIGVLAAALVITGVTLLSRSPDNFREKYAGTDLSSDVSGIERSGTYAAYLEKYADLPPVSEPVAVDLSAFSGEGGELSGDGLMTTDGSALTWKVNVPRAGLYNIRLDYLTVDCWATSSARASSAFPACGRTRARSAGTTRETRSGPPRRSALKSRAPGAWTTWATRRNPTPSISMKGRTS